MRVALLIPLLVGCRRPPPAPEGIDDSARHLLREFHADDETFGAGLVGLVQWFDAEGYELLGVAASQDNVEGFVLDDLTPEDVGAYEVSDDVPDVAEANGAIGMAELACTPAALEALLVRADQMTVFEGEFDAYTRTFASDRAAFEDATAAGWPAVDEPMDVDAGAFDPGALLLTDNAVTVSAFGSTVSYTLVRHFRHGRFDVEGEPVDALFALGWLPAPSNADGGNRVLQSWGVEMAIARADRPTLRLFATWNHFKSALIASDSPIWQTSAVNQTRDSAERLSSICDGSVDLDEEP